MTEADWLACRDVGPMLDHVRKLSYSGQPLDRRTRLFACACCRRAWPLLFGPSRQAVEVAEGYADDSVSLSQLEAAADKAWAVCETAGGRLVCAAQAAFFATQSTPDMTADMDFHAALAVANGSPDPLAEEAAQADLVRDIFGNPFRPVAADPRWLTPTVLAITEGIYADRAFDRLPVLGDALEDAGCENADLLAHCRSEGPHVRGCWAVDLVLGKE